MYRPAEFRCLQVQCMQAKCTVKALRMDVSPGYPDNLCSEVVVEEMEHGNQCALWNVLFCRGCVYRSEGRSWSQGLKVWILWFYDPLMSVGSQQCTHLKILSSMFVLNLVFVLQMSSSDSWLSAEKRYSCQDELWVYGAAPVLFSAYSRQRYRRRWKSLLFSPVRQTSFKQLLILSRWGETLPKHRVLKVCSPCRWMTDGYSVLAAETWSGRCSHRRGSVMN